MKINLSQDWPVYILLTAVVSFIIYVIIQGNKEERRNKEITKDNK